MTKQTSLVEAQVRRYMARITPGQMAAIIVALMREATHGATGGKSVADDEEEECAYIRGVMETHGFMPIPDPWEADRREARERETYLANYAATLGKTVEEASAALAMLGLEVARGIGGRLTIAPKPAAAPKPADAKPADVPRPGNCPHDPPHVAGVDDCEPPKPAETKPAETKPAQTKPTRKK